MNARLPGFYRRTAEEQAEDFEAAVIDAKPAARAKIAQDAAAGDYETLSALDYHLCEAIGQTEDSMALIRTLYECGPEQAGLMLRRLLDKGFEFEAGQLAQKAAEDAGQLAHDRCVDDLIEQGKFSSMGAEA